MYRFARWTPLAGTLGFLSLVGVAGAEEEKISAKELPKAVIKTIKEKFPKAKIEEAAKEEEEGKTIYEVSLEVKERKVDVSLKPNGTILEIEKEVPLSELPGAVKKALAAKYPKAKIEKAETITKGEDGPTNYEVVLETEVVVSPKGKFVEAEESEEEDDEKPSARKSEKEEDDDEPKAKSKKKAEKEEDEDDDRPKAKSKKKAEKEEDEDDDEPKAKSKKKAEKEDEDDDRPKAKSKKKAEKEEDEDDDKPKAKSKKKAEKEDEDEDEDDDEDDDEGAEKGHKD